MRLQILVPQYKENETVVHFLLDSIESQINVDKKDFEVLIGNDGSDVFLSKRFLKKYSFPIQYHKFEHSRLAGCRKKLFDIATADYVMFCDADDCFISNIAFSIIFNLMSRRFDMLICDFFEERKDFNGNIYYIPHRDDNTFVHGKIYCRDFLLNNNICWHPELHEHQDGCYTALAKILSKKTTKCSLPLYLWKNNPDSVSRKDGNIHIIKTLDKFVDAQDFLVQDLIEHNLHFNASVIAIFVMFYCYYLMANDLWHVKKNNEYKQAIYTRVRCFYNKYKTLMDTVDNEKDVEKIQNKVKEIISTKYKPLLNTKLPPFEEWIKCLVTLF